MKKRINKKASNFLTNVRLELVERNKKKKDEDDGSESDPSNEVTVPVVDHLNSKSTTKALSANQGKVLNEKINSIGKVNIVKQW